MAAVYQSRTGPMYRYCRKMLALPFLPAPVIESTFADLATQATTTELQQLNSYVSATWLNNDLWPPTSWSCYRQSIRTNNDTEAWHARLGRRTGCGNLGLYQLAGRLYDEGRLVALSMKLMSERRVARYQRASTVRINAALEKHYSEYEAGTRSAMQLLRCCARVYAYSCR